MGLFGGEDKKDKKKGLLDDVLGPTKPFGHMDMALDSKNANLMGKINRNRAGYVNSGLSFQDSLFADSINNGLDLAIAQGFGFGKTSPPPAPSALRRAKSDSPSPALHPFTGPTGQLPGTAPPSGSKRSVSSASEGFGAVDIPPSDGGTPGGFVETSVYDGALRGEVAHLRASLPKIGVFPEPETHVGEFGVQFACAAGGTSLVISMSARLGMARIVSAFGGSETLRDRLPMAMQALPDFEIIIDDDGDLLVASPDVALSEFIKEDRFLDEVRGYMDAIDRLLGTDGLLASHSSVRKSNDNIIRLIEDDYLTVAAPALASGKMSEMFLANGDVSGAEFCRMVAEAEIDNAGGIDEFANMIRLMHIENKLKQAPFPVYMSRSLEPSDMVKLLYRIMAGEEEGLNEPWFIRSLYCLAIYQWAGDGSPTNRDLCYRIHATWKGQLQKFLTIAAHNLLIGHPEEVVMLLTAGDLEEGERETLAHMLKSCFDPESRVIEIRNGVIGHYMMTAQNLEPAVRLLLVSLSFGEYEKMQERTRCTLDPSLMKTQVFAAIDDPFDGEPAELLWAEKLNTLLQEHAPADNN